MTALVDEVTAKMLTWDEALEALAVSEPLSSHHFSANAESKIHVELPPGFNAGLKEKEGGALTDATISFGNAAAGLGYELQLTKDALLDLTSSIGITREYICKTPGTLLMPHLDYWMKTVERDYRFLTDGGGTALALTKSASIVPFSNVKLMETVGTALVAKGIAMDEVKVDYKMHHDLKRTSVRLVVPGKQLVIESLRGGQSNPDTWSTGLQLSNSLTGHTPTSLSGYLFAWWCLNGAIATHAESARYNRKAGQESLEINEWAAGNTVNVLKDLDAELEAVSVLTKVDLGAELSDTLVDVFKTEKVPTSQREAIILSLLEMEDTTAYGVMQAITQAANGAEVADEDRERLMRIGGSIPALMGDRCNECHRLALK